MTFPEKKIWYEFLRKLDIPINRQKIIDIYIVDFYCSEEILSILEKELQLDRHELINKNF